MTGSGQSAKIPMDGWDRPMDAEIRAAIEQFPRERGYLVPMLYRVQEIADCLSPEAIAEIGCFLDISENEVYSVASFYPQFRLTRPGSQ